MSREIKYRVWDNENKSYNDPYSYAYYAMTQDGRLDFYCHGDRMDEADPEIYIIEQYTGLKDKNGKEIYEGDIVALLFGYVPMKSVTTENIRIENAQKAVIHFDTARAAFRYTIKLRTPKDCQFKPGTKTNMVVIGNIHENPELLGGEE